MPVLMKRRGHVRLLYGLISETLFWTSLEFWMSTRNSYSYCKVKHHTTPYTGRVTKFMETYILSKPEPVGQLRSPHS